MDEVDLLEKLFVSVCVPQAVIDELKHPKAPPKVNACADSLPPRANVKLVPSIAPAFTPSNLKLDLGEQEALTLAQSEKADLILVDETRARRVAQREEMRVMGTIGVLELASQRGYLNLAEALIRLRDTTFRFPEGLIESILRQNR